MTQVADSTVEWIHVSLRDYFAAAALTGWAAGRNRAMDHLENSEPERVAVACFRYADAMLAEREKSKE